MVVCKYTVGAYCGVVCRSEEERLNIGASLICTIYYITHNWCVWSAPYYITHNWCLWSAPYYITHNWCVWSAPYYITHNWCVWSAPYTILPTTGVYDLHHTIITHNWCVWLLYLYNRSHDLGLVPQPIKKKAHMHSLCFMLIICKYGKGVTSCETTDNYVKNHILDYSCTLIGKAMLIYYKCQLCIAHCVCVYLVTRVMPGNLCQGLLILQ